MQEHSSQEPISKEIHDVLEFSQFRLKLIGFLRLPLNVSETALRDVIRRASRRVFEIYSARAERIRAEGNASFGAH